jgi:small-conductance mechanosensitive channel
MRHRYGWPVERQQIQQVERQQIRQGDPAGDIGRVKKPNRPLRAIGALAVSTAAAVAVHVVGVPLDATGAQLTVRANQFVPVMTGRIVTVVGAIAFCLFGLVSAFAFARWARSMLEHVIGPTYGAILRYVVILIGICVIGATTLDMLSFPVHQLLVGGVVTGVLISIAAQQSLGNLFAGVMLQFARPFRVGDRVRIRAGALSGTIEGTVADFTVTYVRLETDDGRVLLPNAQVLAAAVSPVSPAPPAPLADPVDAAHGSAGCER